MGRPRYTQFNCHSCMWYYHQDMICNVDWPMREMWSGGTCDKWEPCGDYLDRIECGELPPIPADKPKQ